MLVKLSFVYLVLLASSYIVIYCRESSQQFKLFLHIIIALFNFKLLNSFCSSHCCFFSYAYMADVGDKDLIRVCFSLCDVKTKYIIVIPNKFSICKALNWALDDFSVSYCSLINIYLGTCAHFQIQRGRLSLP